MSNRIPSVETKVENSTNVDATSVCPNNAKPNVGCRFSLSKLKRFKIFKSEAQEMKFYMIGSVISLIVYIVLSTLRELR